MGWAKPSVFRGIKEFIKMPLRHICNLSFNTGVFPWELQIANVVPIFKSGDDMLFFNYRPVSVLPVFSKVIERLMYHRLIGFINDNDMLYEYQFGFQKGKSTYMALGFPFRQNFRGLSKWRVGWRRFSWFFQGVWHGWSRCFTDENEIIWYHKHCLWLVSKLSLWQSTVCNL